MRHFTLALGFLAAVASAQTPEETRALERVFQAYDHIRSPGDFSLSVSGTDAQPGRRDEVRCDVFWSPGENDVPKVDLRGYRNGTLTNHLVGDGQILWSYNPLRNEYSATRYAQPGGDALKALLNALGSSARAHELHAVRVLREIVSIRPGYWSPIPAAPPTDRNVEPYEEEDEDLLYRLGDPVRRQVFYDLVPPAPDGSTGWRLNAIHFYDATRVGTLHRELTLKLVRGPQEPDHPFTFKPPVRARPVRG